MELAAEITRSDAQALVIGRLEAISWLTAPQGGMSEVANHRPRPTGRELDLSPSRSSVAK